MPLQRCLISFRLAGVCRTCKRATWPAHIAADLSVYWADCCEACRLDRAPVENPRAKAPGRRAIRSARPGKRGDTRPPEPGPCCAVSGPARDAASVKPSEAAPRRKGRAVDRGPSENRLAKGPLAGAVALPGPAEQDLAMTADGPHRASAGRRLRGPGGLAPGEGLAACFRCVPARSGFAFRAGTSASQGLGSAFLCGFGEARTSSPDRLPFGLPQFSGLCP